MSKLHALEHLSVNFLSLSLVATGAGNADQMGNPEPFKSSIPVPPLRASPTPVHTYVGLTRCSEVSHLWKLLQECGLVSRSLSVAIAVSFMESHETGPPERC